MPLLWTAVALFLAGLVLFAWRFFHRQQAAIAAGTAIAYDTVERPSPVLFSRRYGLKGRPDALLQTSAGVIPIERKSARAPRQPHESDVLQAAVYCLLVEETYGRTPPFMRIHYPGKWFDVPFTPEHREWVVGASTQLRMARTAGLCDRSHNFRPKCLSCVQRSHCNQSLV
jgi:CRISPR-associated exonuclease Cas4